MNNVVQDKKMKMRKHFILDYNFLAICLVAFLLLDSCKTGHRQMEETKSALSKCDELKIIYYSEDDTFAFITTAPTTIKNFTDLISLRDESLSQTCPPTQKLIYNYKGYTIFTADVAVSLSKSATSCNYVMYSLDSKNYKHRLTYQTGMGIDEIYWHKVNPRENPWAGIDTTSFHYEY
jgi:hypothetical protein